jgi:hypothetical protein
MAISETVLILAGGTAVLSIAFGIRVAVRTMGGDGTAAPGGSSPPDVAGVIALPPLIFLGFLASAAVLEAVVPLPVLAGHALARYLAGVALAVVGFVLLGMGTRRFQAAGTNIPTSLPTTAPPSRRYRAGRALSVAQVRRFVSRVQGAGAAVDLILLLSADLPSAPA